MNYFDTIAYCAQNNICFICKNKISNSYHKDLNLFYKCNTCDIVYKHCAYPYVLFTIDNLHICINGIADGMSFYYGNRDEFKAENCILTYYFNFDNKCSKQYIYYSKNIKWKSEQIDSFIIESHEDLKEFCYLLSKIQVFS